VIHANHAGTSWPKPPGVADAMRDALLADPREHGALFVRAHAAIARFLGVHAAAERLVLTPSCTAALAVVLADLPWERGDVVVTSSLEHHALARPVQRLVWDRGVENVAVPRAADGPIDLDAVESALRGGRVRLVAVTAASNVTGEVLPLARLTELAHAHGALVLVDSAQLAGVLPFDPVALAADLFVFAGHKGLLGPLGIGGFWAAPHVRFACPGASCDVGGAHGGTSAFPGFCDVGSVNLPGACGLAAALDWLAQRPDAERRRPVELAARLRAGCAQRPHCRVLGSASGEHTATVGLVLDGVELGAAERHFLAHGIVVRAGQHCAPMALRALGAPDGCVRIGFGVTNGDRDADAVLAAIDAGARA
jgi:selenocysteine lyase/cysteine desulfurase